MRSLHTSSVGIYSTVYTVLYIPVITFRYKMPVSTEPPQNATYSVYWYPIKFFILAPTRIPGRIFTNLC